MLRQATFLMIASQAIFFNHLQHIRPRVRLTQFGPLVNSAGLLNTTTEVCVYIPQFYILNGFTIEIISSS